jgi:hypothetical protein
MILVVGVVLMSSQALLNKSAIPHLSEIRRAPQSGEPNREVSTSFAYFPKNRRGTPKSKFQRNANIFLFLSNHAFS